MISINTNEKFRLWFLWTLSYGIGWFLIGSPSLIVRNTNINSWEIVQKTAWDILIGALILGLATGLIQFLIMRFDMTIKPQWIFVFTMSHGIGLSAGFLISVLILAYPILFSNSWQGFLITPFPIMMFIGGGISGAIQSLAIKREGYLKKYAVTLWVAINALGWGAGFFASAYGLAANIPLNGQSGLIGLAIGAITGLFLFLTLYPEEVGSVESSPNST